MADLQRVRPTSRELQAQAPLVSPESFGVGVATALGQLGQAVETTSRLGALGEGTARELADAQTTRDRKIERSSARVALLRRKNELTVAAGEMVRDAPEGGGDLTNDITLMANEGFESFSADLPDYLKREFAVEIEQARLGLNNFGRVNQLSAENKKFYVDTGTLGSEYVNEILSGSDPELTYERGLLQLEELAKDNILTGDESKELFTEINLQLQTALYSRLAVDEAQREDSFGGNVPGRLSESSSGVWKSSNGAPVGAGMGRAQVGFLTAVYSNESRGGEYNAQYTPDGSAARYFDNGFAEHPNEAAKITEGAYEGQDSTAAGAPQFIIGTWREAQKDLAARGQPLRDFSPAEQDRAAWYIAEKRYATLTGGADLQSDLMSNNRDTLAKVKASLNGTWPSLGAMSLDKFVNYVQGAQGNPSSLVYDERFSDMPYGQRVELAAAAEADALAIQTQIQTERAAEIARQFEQAQTGIQDGLIRTQTELNNLASQNGFTFDQRKELSDQFGEKHERDISVGSYVAARASGATFDSNDAGQKEDAQHYTSSDIVQGALDSQDPQEIFDALAPVAASGYIPTNLTDNLFARTNDRNPLAADSAWSTLAMLQAENGTALGATLSDEQLGNITQYNLLRNMGRPLEELQGYFRGSTDPTIAAGRKARSDSFGVYMNDNRESFFPAAVYKELGLKMDPDGVQSELVTNEYQALFRYLYIQSGDERTARKAAVEVMKKRWGAQSIFGKPQLMKHAFTSNFPTFDGGHDYVDEQITSQLGLRAGDHFLIQADATTNALVAAQEIPTYPIMTASPMGDLRPMPFEETPGFEDVKTAFERDEITEAQREFLAQQPVRWNPQITDTMRENLAQERANETQAQQLLEEGFTVEEGEALLAREGLTDAERAIAERAVELVESQTEPTPTLDVEGLVSGAREQAGLPPREVQQEPADPLGSIGQFFLDLHYSFKVPPPLAREDAYSPLLFDLRARQAPVPPEEALRYRSIIDMAPLTPFEREVEMQKLEQLLKELNE